MMIQKLRCLWGSTNASKISGGNLHSQSQSRFWRIVRRIALALFGAAITTQAAMATSVIFPPPLSVQPVIAAPNVARTIKLRATWPQGCPLPLLSLDTSYVEQSSILVIRARTVEPPLPPRCSDTIVPIQLEISYTPTTANVLRIVVQSDFPSLRLEGNLITGESTTHSLRDISGLWFDPGKSGSGLFLQHGFNRTDAVFGSLYLYDQEGVTRWYSIQNGRWLPSGDLEATLFESRSANGCTTAPPNCPAPAVINRTVGTVSISVSSAFSGQPTQMLLQVRLPDGRLLFDFAVLNRLEF